MTTRRRVAKSSYSPDRLATLDTAESIGICRRILGERDDYRRGKRSIYMDVRGISSELSALGHIYLWAS